MSSVYEVITNRIIEHLESGVIPWQKPWVGSENAPKNLISGKEYRGINVWMLSVSPYSSPFWLTYKQATELGGHVRKGEHGTPVVFWKFGTYETQDGDQTEKHTSVLCRYYTVFNYEQCEGLRVQPVQSDATRNPFSPIETCEQLVSGYLAKPPITHSEEPKAYYLPLADRIHLPNHEQFRSPEDYYATLFHELTHSTGHKSRLDREGVTQLCPFGTTNYSKEELIAEMGAAYLCGFAGIENKPALLENSAAYLNSWIRKLKGDSRLIISAAAQAQKAIDYIRGNVQTAPAVSQPVVYIPAPQPLAAIAA
jgi:antirestriction protein ArdC